MYEKSFGIMVKILERRLEEAQKDIEIAKARYTFYNDNNTFSTLISAVGKFNLLSDILEMCDAVADGDWESLAAYLEEIK